LALLTPVWLGIAMLFGEISGGFAAQVLGSPFGLPGAFVGVSVIAALLSFALCLLTLRIMRRIIEVESAQSGSA
jgi:hypothetical protein